MQQINLYLPELRPKQEWLTARSICLCAIGFICLMAVNVYIQTNDLEKIEAQVSILEAQQAGVVERVTRIQSAPRQVQTVSLDRQIEELKKKIAMREQIGSVIHSQSFGNQQGFSEAMNGFARQSLSSISLEHIRISRGGNFIELKGKTQSAEDIPKYIALLRQEDSFQTTQFGLMSVASQSSAKSHEFALGFDSVYDLVAEQRP